MDGLVRGWWSVQCEGCVVDGLVRGWWNMQCEKCVVDGYRLVEYEA